MDCIAFTTFNVGSRGRFDATGTTYGAVTCDVGDKVLMTSSEVAAMLPNTSLFNLTSAAGAQIASAVLVVWAVGFGFRVLVRVLSIDGKLTSESES